MTKSRGKPRDVKLDNEFCLRSRILPEYKLSLDHDARPIESYALRRSSIVGTEERKTRIAASPRRTLVAETYNRQGGTD